MRSDIRVPRPVVAGAGGADAFAFAVFRGVGSGERTRTLANDPNGIPAPATVERHTH